MEKVKDYFDLTGQVAVITGCSTGLGVQMAEALATQGCNIVALSRRQSKVDEVAARIREVYGVETMGVACDITDTYAIVLAASWAASTSSSTTPAPAAWAWP